MGSEAETQPPELAKALLPRHVTMISLGGVIGAGLFVGSSAAIATIGPAVIVSYALAGLIVLTVMQVIARLAVALPHAGAFTEYPRAGIGRWAGFTAGWLYWYFWAVVVAIEAIAGAAIIAQWLAAPVWLIGFVLMLVLTATNLFSTRGYGEFEFWFSTIKVVAIILFIVASAVYLLGVAGPSPGLANLVADGGFAPNGWGVVLAGVTTVVFALVGAEIVTIAAAEADNSATLVARLTTTLMLRIIIFYLGAIALIVAIVPWRDIVPGSSPFTAALAVIGVPGAVLLMDLVVLVAVLSCLNSALYVASRALFRLAAHGDAPRWTVAINARGVPARAILAGTAFGFAGVIASVLSPGQVFAFLVNASGAVILFVYLLTVVAAIRLGVGTGPILRWGRHAVILAMLAVLVAMQQSPALATQLYASLGALAIVLSAYRFVRRRRSLQIV